MNVIEQEETILQRRNGNGHPQDVSEEDIFNLDTLQEMKDIIKEELSACEAREKESINCERKHQRLARETLRKRSRSREWR